MFTRSRDWSLLLWFGAGLALLQEPPPRVPRPTATEEAALAGAARSERLLEHMQCLREREGLLADIRSRQARCDSQLKQYEACRAERAPLEGSELLGCGLGLAVGLAAGGIAQPWSLDECGVARPPESRKKCSPPACERDWKAVEHEVLAARGLTVLPRCEQPTA